jgi:SAM-dependent methyltransferase
MAFQDGVRDMLLSMSDMFSWMGRNMAHEAGSDEILRSTLPASETVAPEADSHLTDADIYDGIYERNEITAQEATFVLDRLDSVATPSVLDLCAGTGSLVRLLADRGAQVTGLDSSEALLAVARRKVPEGKFLQGDIRSLQLDERFAAIVCMNGALHSIEEPQDIVRVLRLAKNHLRPGGALVVELRDRKRLPLPSNGNGKARSLWLPRHGQEDSDLFAFSGVDKSSGRHVLDVRNFFHTDPYRIANWARMVGLADIQLQADYLHDESYQRSSGNGKVLLVARRPDPARHSNASVGEPATSV